jgi:glycosyltransferase involved in cell wall biosynthesis
MVRRSARSSNRVCPVTGHAPAGGLADQAGRRAWRRWSRSLTTRGMASGPLRGSRTPPCCRAACQGPGLPSFPCPTVISPQPSSGAHTAALAAAQPLGVRVVQTFHALGTVKQRHQGSRDTSAPERVGEEQRIAAGADRVLATCTDEVFELLRMGARRQRISIVPCGVDLDLFRPAVPACPPRGGLHRFVAVGRLVERKGVGNTILALAELPDCELLVAGGPEARHLHEDRQAERLLRLAEAEGVADRVRLLGSLDPAAARTSSGRPRWRGPRAARVGADRRPPQPAAGGLRRGDRHQRDHAARPGVASGRDTPPLRVHRPGLIAEPARDRAAGWSADFDERPHAGDSTAFALISWARAPRVPDARLGELVGSKASWGCTGGGSRCSGTCCRTASTVCERLGEDQHPPEPVGHHSLLRLRYHCYHKKQH